MQLGVRYAPQGYGQVTSLSSAKGLPTIGSPADIPQGRGIVALIEAEAQNVRWRDDGTAPTSSIGMLLAAGSTLEYTGDLSAIEFIEATSGAILNVSYYKISG